METEGTTTAYRVELPTFRGPLDLLLYLVKKYEVDILDIPIATIANSFLRYLDVIKMIDIESAGEFLVMASTLMEIKSRMMLPQRQEESAEETASNENQPDPRAELVKQLVAYRRFREASDELEHLLTQQSVRWPRGCHEKPSQIVDPKQQPLQQVELWDLVSAFDRLLRATLTNQGESITVDDTPQHIHIENMIQLLSQASGPLPFESLFTPPHTRGRLIGLFLALLELIKLKRIQVEQPEPFAEIMVRLIAGEELAQAA